MKTQIVSFILLQALGFILLGLTAGAGPADKKSTVKKPVQTQAPTKTKPKAESSLSTDVKFGDQNVGGKYQLPMEALSVVENEKSIDDLIGVRKNFRDRVARSKGMR